MHTAHTTHISILKTNLYWLTQAIATFRELRAAPYTNLSVAVLPSPSPVTCTRACFVTRPLETVPSLGANLVVVWGEGNLVE